MTAIRRIAQVTTCLLTLLSCSLLTAQEAVKIWEFSPYEVEIWYSFQPSVTVSESARQQFVSEVEAELSRTFRAAWRVQSAELAPEWAGIARRNFREFKVNDLTLNELVLAVSVKHEQTKTIRTMEAAIEQLSEIPVSEAGLLRLEKAAARFSVADDSPAKILLSKCKATPELGLAELKSKLVDAEIPCAILPRSELAGISDKVRSLLTTLPWNTDSLLKRKDKIMFLSIDQKDDAFHIQARELDCPMRFMGPTFENNTLLWPHAARQAAHAVVKAFAPVCRVEDSEALTASLLHRAGGLIVHDQNPARIHVGDVMQPIVRRDGKNGVPTLLQPLSWTFAAITQSDGVKMQANVYSYSGGPGLQGRRNRRTQRVVLRVRPIVEETDIEVVVRNSLKPQSGSFVFQRDLLTGEFDELGRTDWRGRFRVKVPEDSGKFLEASVRKERLLAKRNAQMAVAKAEAALTDAAKEGTAPEEKKKRAEEKKAADAALAAFDKYDPEKDKEALPLNFPLIEIYVRNGNEVLAKLPMVPGLSPIETAELRDDSRRLQTEAFVNGFSGEIVSVIGLRNILAASIKLNLKKKDLDEASRNLAQMREIPTYEQLADELDAIQRVMLDEKRGAVTQTEKRKIDRMFQTTSDLLQKYLQDSLFQKSLQAIEDAGGKTVGSTKRKTVGDAG